MSDPNNTGYQLQFACASCGCTGFHAFGCPFNPLYPTSYSYTPSFSCQTCAWLTREVDRLREELAASKAREAKPARRMKSVCVPDSDDILGFRHEYVPDDDAATPPEPPSVQPDTNQQ